MLFENFVSTRSGSCRTRGGDLVRSTWRSDRDTIARSRIPVRIAKATKARLRRSMTVSIGIAAITARTCSRLGKSRSFAAFAVAPSLHRQAKIVDVRYVDCRLEAWLPGEPGEEVLQRGERDRLCSEAESFARALAIRLS